MVGPGPQPIGVVLAGGAGRRLGGAKPTARLGDRPLLDWVVRAFIAARDRLGGVAVVAKPRSVLPVLAAEVPVWLEPAEPVHPLAGILFALTRSGGRPVLVCAVDLPFVDGAALRTLCATAPGAAVVLAAGQPLLGRYSPEVVPALAAAVEGGWSVRRAVAELGAVEVTIPGRALFNVNTPEDLVRAEAMVAAGRRAAAPRWR